MAIRWSPHPRYRLYTGPASYGLPVRQVIGRFYSYTEAAARLEGEICKRFDIQASVCVPMARTGLYFALKELIRPGQTVIMSPLTIIDVVNMVLLAGGIPVFADIRRTSCAVDPDQVESLIDARTGAVLITHLHGETAGAHDFCDICKRRGVPLIEDAAQSFGTVEKGRRLGTIGDLGIYSFGFYKNVNAWRGGMLVSSDQQLIARIRRRMKGLPAFSSWQLLALAAQGLLTDIATYPPHFATIISPMLRLSFLHDVNAAKRWLDPEDKAKRLSKIPPDYLTLMGPSQIVLAYRQLDQVDSDSRARIAKAVRYDEALSKLEMLIRPQRPSTTVS